MTYDINIYYFGAAFHQLPEPSTLTMKVRGNVFVKADAGGTLANGDFEWTLGSENSLQFRSGTCWTLDPLVRKHIALEIKDVVKKYLQSSFPTQFMSIIQDHLP